MIRKTLNVGSFIFFSLAIFFIGFISDKFIRYWSFFTIKKELDLPATILGFITIAVTISAAFWVAKILENEKDESRIEKNLIIDKIQNLFVLTDQFYDKVATRRLPLLEVTAILKRVLTNLALVKDILSNTRISQPSDLQKEIEASIKSIRDLLTNTPTEPSQSDPVTVVDGQVNISENGMLALDVEFNHLTNCILKYQLAINKG